jgi:protein-export membrane protein SecD/preprotein translocase SecF subunit
MWDFIKRWHPVLLLILGLYLAIPKPEPERREIQDEYLEENDTNKDGYVDKDEFKGADFDTLDLNKDGKLSTGQWWQFPLHAYKWNLGQDLKGGSSLRYVLKQQDMEEAEANVRALLEPLADYKDKLSPEALDKFGDVIDGGALIEGAWETGDFDLLRVPAQFDEDRADALRRYYQTWNDAKKRRDEKNLVGPTIETLNRRLGATGITELNISPLGDDRLEVKLPEFSTSAETDRYKQLLETTGKLQMRVLAAEDGDFRNLEVGDLPRDEGYKYKWIELERDDATSSSLVKEKDGKKFVPVLIIDEYDITGKDLANIQPTTDKTGRMAVSFDLKGLAVTRFEDLTRKHKVASAGGEDPRLLAIVIDDKIYSAYTIQDTISGSVQLSGNFSVKERDDIINVLKSGSLNVKLVMEGEESVGPSEGAEAVQRGLMSLGIGAVLVFLFALFVYRGLGALTIVNLVIVVTLLMGAMAAGLGTLTMPGIAGIVLTIGMAIDANILINERIREEREKNKNMRGAVEEGFKNALSAIVDANVTTLITALILYKVGSGPIQGFALTLAIGIVATLYTALAAYRAMVFGILNVKRDAQFNMAGLAFARNRNINWLRMMPVGALVAAILVISGGSFMFTHGGEVLGIEFRGGHTFRIQMKEAMTREAVADQVIDPDTNQGKFDWSQDAEVQPVFRLGNEFEGGQADRFDFRFPMQPEWEDRSPEEITELLQAHLEEVYSEQMVDEGWKARAEGVTETILEAHFTLSLKDAEAFREAYPDDFDVLWLSKDRAWGGDPNAPKAKKDTWFGGLSANSIEVVMTPNAAGDRQRLIVRALGVPVTNDDDSKNKLTTFQSSVERYFWNDSQNVQIEGKPDFRQVPTKARLLVEVVFLAPVETEKFTQFIQGVPSTATGALAGTSLTTTPLEDKDGQARRFEIRSGEMSFSANPADESHFSRVGGQLSTSVKQWVEREGGEGNEISQRFLLSSAVGATVASEAQWRALFAIIAALVVVVIYIRIRFASVAWGMAAVVALLHDSFVVVGLIGLADYLGADIKIDLTVVAAILTVIGYSLNDTIINFDRIRENLKNDRLATGGKTPLKEIINTSINQMLSRTVMTSGTTLLTTLTMLAFGGPLLKGFAFAMTAGIVVGTFSSIYIAGPILLFFDKRGEGMLLDVTEEEADEIDKAAANADVPEPSPEDFKDEGDDKPADSEDKSDKQE